MNDYSIPDQGIYSSLGSDMSGGAYAPPPPPYQPYVPPAGVYDTTYYPQYYNPYPAPYGAPPPKPIKKINYTPLIVYFILVLIWIVATIFAPNTGSSKVLTILSGLFWALLWAALIWMLCRRGHTGWAWVLALFSLVIWAIVIILIFIGLIVFSI